jgi:aspartate/methionine/tyrosine aminotransferase
VPFSRRVPQSLAENAIAAAIARRQAAGLELLDLTVSNPTVVGLDYPPALIELLADPRALRYDPHPFGAWDARAAVAAGYSSAGVELSPADLFLTASTSEAYGFLFKLLCDPGDEVVVPAPSYPLFEHLARLEGIRLRTCPLDYHGVWSLDLSGLEEALAGGARAVVVVAPNNPTGSYLRRGQWAPLHELCAARGAALICDEVFREYPVDPAADAMLGPCFAEDSQDGVLVFSLGGVSKSLGLPQHKLSWCVLRGPADTVAQARARLEFICDSYLSVGTAVQMALPRLLAEGTVVRDRITERLRQNWMRLRCAIPPTAGCDLLRVEGGWSAVMRVPAREPEESLVIDLIGRDGVVVHPGFFFDFPSEAYLVVSLLVSPDVFEDGVLRICRRVAAA